MYLMSILWNFSTLLPPSMQMLGNFHNNSKDDIIVEDIIENA